MVKALLVMDATACTSLNHSTVILTPELVLQNSDNNQILLSQHINCAFCEL